MNIRKARASDLPLLVSLNREIGELHVHLRPQDFKSVSDEQSYKALSAFLEAADAQTFVACLNDELVGFVIVKTLHRDEEAFRPAADYLLVHHLVVAAKHRRKRVATALLKHVENLAKEAGISRLEIQVYSKNLDAMRFYDRLGFTSFKQFLEKELPSSKV